MADDSDAKDAANAAKGIDVDRSTDPATYTDHRDFLTKMHSALGGLLGIGAPRERSFGPHGKSATDVVDEAVAGTKANPDPEYN